MSRKNAVALYLHRLTNKGGGAQRMVCWLAEALVARNFDVHLISWDDLQGSCFYPVPSSVRFHRLGFRRGIANKVERTCAVAQLLSQLNIPVLVGFVMSGDRTVFVGAKLARVKVIAAERNAPQIYHLRYSALERWLSLASLHLADRITVQFPEFVRGYPSTLQGRIEVIPNPVQVAAKLASPHRAGSNGRYTLLAVSRLDRVQKRLHMLIEAFALVALSQPDWDLLIVGDGPEEAALGRLVADRGLIGRVVIVPSIQDVFSVYCNAHLFALPSRWEGFSNALAEAMAHGLPAVGYRGAPGVAQLIADGVTGWLADGLDDERALAKALEHAMANHEERARRGLKGVDTIAAFTPEVQYDRWAQLIRSVAEL